MKPDEVRRVRRVRYSVAMSLDGYIAGPDGEADWIVMDPEIDFAAHWAQFDTLLMGRRTFEPMAKMQSKSKPSMRIYVFSRTLKREDHPDVTIVKENAAATVAELRAAEGKDIWLFGGGSLFQSLLDAGQVDRVEVGIIPVLLGGGVPFLLSPAARAKLKLTGHRIHEKSGIVGLEYDVQR